MAINPNDSQAQPNFYITRNNFEQLIAVGSGRVNDLPPGKWVQIRQHFGNTNTLAVFASGVTPQPISPPDNLPVGGIDWVRLENKPRANEPILNVDHYVIGQPDEFGYPVYGPLKSGSMSDHWSNLNDMSVYFVDNVE